MIIIIIWIAESFFRYNPDNVDTLEDYVRFQAEQDAYNFEANLALLKL